MRFIHLEPDPATQINADPDHLKPWPQLYVSLPAPGHGLKPLDMEFMKQLHDKVNIIPVIAKADTLTEEEIAYFKAQARHATHQQHKQSFPFYIFYKFDADVLDSVRSETEPLKKKYFYSSFFKVVWSAMFIIISF